MKFLFDLFPVLLFFGAYKLSGANAEASQHFINTYLSGIISGGSVTPDQSPIVLATLVGIIGLFAWQLCPQIRVLPHVIYFEWIICIITLLVVRLIDKTPIKMPELKE